MTDIIEQLHLLYAAHPGAEIKRLRDQVERVENDRRAERAEIERLRANMTEIRQVLVHVAGDIRAVFHERPDLYKAIIRVDTIALDPK